MARWRLMAPHYLKSPGTEWEYKEQDQNTKKQVRRVFEVPMYMDPRDPSDHNYPGEIIVCYEGKGALKDIVFLGEPTPDMEPIDEEAQAISKSLAPKWQHPIDTLPSTGDYSASLLTKFQQQLETAISKSVVNTPVKGVSQEQFEALQAQIAKLAKQNAELATRLAAPPAARRA